MKTFVLRESNTALENYLQELPKDGSFKVEVKRNLSKRSLSQNALYWVWVAIISEETGYRKDEVHALLRYQFLPSCEQEIMGHRIHDLPSTTKLNTKEFTEYLNDIENWASDFGITLPHPEDKYYEAMGLVA
jgi:hypothetical protein